MTPMQLTEAFYRFLARIDRDLWIDVWARSCGTEPSATVPYTSRLGQWADVILCMEERHAKVVRADIGDLVPVYVLGIPDRYNRDDPELKLLLGARVPALIERCSDCHHTRENARAG